MDNTEREKIFYLLLKKIHTNTLTDDDLYTYAEDLILCKMLSIELQKQLKYNLFKRNKADFEVKLCQSQLFKIKIHDFFSISIEKQLKFFSFIIQLFIKKVIQLQTSTLTYQTPPSKLFTQTVTHYTHTLSRP